MPSKNVIKQDVAHGFYHVYARGANKQKIFLEASDFEKFLRLFARYLSFQETQNLTGRPFPNFAGKIELNAFCLMPNHFHLLIYQIHPGSMSGLMRSLLTSYSMYFNKKYKRTGPLFESRYKASLISDDVYLEHVSRYIHLNPRSWRDYEYSSLPYYLQRVTDDWAKPNRILERFESPEEYLRFVEDYSQNKEMLNILKHELADNADI